MENRGKRATKNHIQHAFVVVSARFVRHLSERALGSLKTTRFAELRSDISHFVRKKSFSSSRGKHNDETKQRKQGCKPNLIPEEVMLKCFAGF
jgi:hypothetical protein